MIKQIYGKWRIIDKIDEIKSLFCRPLQEIFTILLKYLQLGQEKYELK